MAGKRNIEITKGDDYSHIITLITDAGPVNVTGRTYSAQIRRIPSQVVPDATFTCTVTNGVAGEITAYLAHTITVLLLPGCYRWDFQESAGGILSTLLSGNCQVVAEVTRP